MSKNMYEIYKSMGISEEVYHLGEAILKDLTHRFEEIDKTAEYNQLKVIGAMQKHRVSEACLQGTTGYGGSLLCSYQRLRLQRSGTGHPGIGLCLCVSHGICSCTPSDYLRNPCTGSSFDEQSQARGGASQSCRQAL